MVFALALAAGIWWWIGQSKMGYTFHAVICQPIVMALPFGIIAGDVGTAMKIGANVEMVYLGMVAAGANIPADECLAGCISIPIALLTGNGSCSSSDTSRSIWSAGRISGSD